MTDIITLGKTQKRLFQLDNRHIIRDGRTFKSSADPYFDSAYRLREEVEDWLAEHDVMFNWKGDIHRNIAWLYIDDAKQAMMFKLRWM